MLPLLRSAGPGSDTSVIPIMAPTLEWTEEELRRDPNVIVVLSEAFWDPTQIAGLQFSRDPIPVYHALQKVYTSGTMLSPQYGGGTANVEFEVLTGNSMRFLPEDDIAYETAVKHNVDSLAGILGRQGYTSTAITPFHNWYFDSTNVYRRFGFSRYISLEFFNPDEYVGPYIGDHAVARRIIEETRRSGGSDFIFANTMENHYHYWPNKFKNNTVQIKGKVPGAALAILETYAQGASGADAMLQQLVEHYSRLKEPTILVFFGDHLPQLEKDYYVYRETKYIESENDPDFLPKMYNVPVLIWNNYMTGPKDNLYISPSFLSPYILQLAKKPGSAYTDYLADLSQRTPVIPPRKYYEAMQINPAELAPYEAWQRSILTGAGADSGAGSSGVPGGVPDSGSPDVSGSVYEKVYRPHAPAEVGTGLKHQTGGRTGASESSTVTHASANFILGYGEPVIESVSPSPLDIGESAAATITVTGGRFGMGSVVCVNGKELETTWHSEETISAVLPKELQSNPEQLGVEVRVIDEKGTILARSKTFLLSMAQR
ncbi:LTA synthase family protein [Paenibacillus xerothermodurans]|uniref:LTA synthase family protein n=2 Tax=Paenibacillus xerothermodurans TaxID=1977292 RepID=A0A2W1NE72_PAEXE|nr:LTA synthase family protein [Paenibacillus xerothermodurans]